MTNELENYMMAHRPPDAETGAPLHDLTGNRVYPADFYDRMSEYRPHHDSDFDAMAVLRRLRGKPDRDVQIFRAVPRGVRVFNPGDWVAITSAYARDESRHPSDPSQDLDVIFGWAKARDLHTAGDSFQEWGFNGPVPKRGALRFRARKRSAK